MKKTIKLILLNCIYSTYLFSSNQVTYVDYSLKHVNIDIPLLNTTRIYCKNGKIGQLIYSKDKEFTVLKNDSNAFVKLSPVLLKNDSTVISSKVNDFMRDLYVQCDNKIYSLNLIPKHIVSKTIVLKNSFKKQTINNKPKKNKNFEKDLLNLMVKAYKNKVIQNYKITFSNRLIKKFKELDLYLIKIYKGDRYEIREYALMGKKNFLLRSKNFIPYISNPLALSMSSENIKINKKVRLISITKSMH